MSQCTGKGTEKKKKKSGRTDRKGRGMIPAAVSAVLILAAGVAGSALYFAGDSSVGRKSIEPAGECLDAGRYGGAFTCCEEALKGDSRSADTYVQAADNLLLKGEFEEASRILEMGLDKAGDDEAARELIVGKMEEVNRAETAAAVSKRLQEYLNNEILLRYGYADLGAQTKEVDIGRVNYAKDSHWTGLSGLAGTRICDLDGDGIDELMTIVLEEENMIMSVYEAEEDGVTKKAECCEKHCDDLSDYNEIWSLLNVESGTYVYYSQDGRSIPEDGVFGAVKLYRYDGENLCTPLVIDLGTGASDLTYKAYRYDGRGMLSSEETLYDETGNDSGDYDWEYYCRREAELFAEYGIMAAPDEGLQASGNGYEEILALSMWGDYRNYHSGECEGYDTVVYHFNDWYSPLLAYERFLKGEETLRVREGAWNRGDRHTDWTFQDILTEIQNEYLVYSDRSEVSGIEYAFMDCGEDGAEEMQVRFVGLDIYSYGDDSELTMVISCRDGQLELLYTCESWARSNTEIDFYGCIDSGGAESAGEFLSEMKYIDGNGDIQTVYEMRYLGGWWAGGITRTAYNTAFAGDEADIAVECYTINGEEYKVLYADESVPEYQNFISLCEQEGIRFVAEEEVDRLIDRRRMELGIKESWENGKGLYWKRASLTENNAAEGNSGG